MLTSPRTCCSLQPTPALNRTQQALPHKKRRPYGIDLLCLRGARQGPASLQDRVLHVLRAHGRMTAADIAEALGLDHYPVRQALSRLRERGLVRVAGMAGHAPRWGGGPPSIWEAIPAD